MLRPQHDEPTRWAEVACLRELLEELASLAAGQFSQISDPPRHNDLYAHMVLTFLGRQTDHAESLIRLGSNRDAVLVARSMIEGLVQLEWASLRPGERARRWWDFQHIDRWRLLRSWYQENLGIDHDTLADAERRARQVGMRYLVKEQEGNRKAGRPLKPDPYCQRWYGMSFRDLCRETKTNYSEKYVTFYKEFSEWHHWNPGGVARALAFSAPDEVAYIRTNPHVTAEALTNGIQALAVTIDHVDRRHDTGVGKELQAIADRYSAVRGLRSHRRR